eukprot:jgi/Galph1/1290/GphlegSOOS_G6058.1
MSRVKKVETKQGPFSFLICCGKENINVLKATEELQGLEEAPIPCYLSSYGAQQDTETLEAFKENQNIYVVSPYQLETIDGLTVCFLSSEFPDREKSFSLLLERVQSLNTPVDIVVIDVPARKLHPRYVFSSIESLGYIDYGPFRFQADSFNSRYVNLDVVGTNHKWLYALSLEPISRTEDCSVMKKVQGNILSCPFQVNVEQENETITQASPNKRQKSSTGGTGSNVASSCWFCLANEKDLHLILDVGEYCYLALAKGYLCKYHVLIVPIEHAGSRFELSSETWKEMKQYLKMVEEWWYSLDMKTFWFERNMKPPSGNDVNHMQIQVIGIPKEDETQSVSTVLDKESRRLGITFWEIESEKEMEETYCKSKQDEFLLFKLPDGSYAIHRIEEHVEQKGNRKRVADKSSYYALFSFGRKIAAIVLGLPDKADWKRSVTSRQEEENMATELQEELVSWRKR